VGGCFGRDLVGLEGAQQVVVAVWEGDAQSIGTSPAFSQEKSGPRPGPPGDRGDLRNPIDQEAFPLAHRFHTPGMLHAGLDAPQRLLARGGELIRV
jgi:hypothetical protein